MVRRLVQARACVFFPAFATYFHQTRPTHLRSLTLEMAVGRNALFDPDRGAQLACRRKHVVRFWLRPSALHARRSRCTTASSQEQRVVISVRRDDPPDWVGRVRRIADACYPERRSRLANPRLANPVTLYLSGPRLGPPSG